MEKSTGEEKWMEVIMKELVKEVRGIKEELMGIRKEMRKSRGVNEKRRRESSYADSSGSSEREGSSGEESEKESVSTGQEVKERRSEKIKDGKGDEEVKQQEEDLKTGAIGANEYEDGGQEEEGRTKTEEEVKRMSGGDERQGAAGEEEDREVQEREKQRGEGAKKIGSWYVETERERKEGTENVQKDGKGATGWKMVERRKRLEQEKKEEVERAWRAEYEERERRKRNVWMRGEAKTEDVGVEQVERAIWEGIGRRMEVAKIIEKMQSGKDGIVVAQMKYEEDKREILRNWNSLPVPHPSFEGCGTGSERTSNMEGEKSEVRGPGEGSSGERRKGKRVNVGKRSIWVDGAEWKWDERSEKWDREPSDERQKQKDGNGKEDSAEEGG